MSRRGLSSEEIAEVWVRPALIKWMPSKSKIDGADVQIIIPGPGATHLGQRRLKIGGMGDGGGHGSESGRAKRETEEKSDHGLSDLIALQSSQGP
jgi:hypothetical protein